MPGLSARTDPTRRARNRRSERGPGTPKIARSANRATNVIGLLPHPAQLAVLLAAADFSADSLAAGRRGSRDTRMDVARWRKRQAG
jgi:hypothetical protein